ncbi:MAG: AMP-binding protein [Promethearchaeota archaeon]|nr:MAG: AMP-binding protein [Candidatus Lokiarchaeota archaeon]
MKTGKGRILKRKAGNRKYNSYWVYIPSKISKDYDFPFRDKEQVLIDLIGEHLEIRKIYNLSELTKTYSIEDATIPKIIESKALLNNNKPFIYYRDLIYSYRDANIISNQIAHALLRVNKSLKLKNPKICLMFPNCPESLFCWFAVAKAGSVFVPISYLLKKDLLEHVLRNSDTEILIIDYKYYPNFKEICERLPNIKKIFIRNAPDDFKFDEINANFEELYSKTIENPNISINSYHPLEILYTSGTTAEPKGILYRNYYTLSGISIGKEWETLGFYNNIKLYCPLPLFQGFARYFMIIPVIYFDGSVIIAEEFDVSTFWSDIQLYQPNCFCYYAAHLTALVNQAPKEMDRNHSIKYAFGAGASKKVWETFERRFGIQIIEMWSLVEGIGLTINTEGSKGGKLGSIGKAARGFEIRLVNSAGNEILPGRDHIGEIYARLRLPYELEYYNLNKENITRKGKERWVYTGDFGYSDNDGFIYYLGRKSDMIVRGEQTFFAIDIEMVANSHPLIGGSAVFEVNDKKSSGKELKICAIIKKDAKITHKEFYNFLKQNLAYFMVPRYIEFKEDLPKNANEFVQKFILQNEWETGESQKNTYDAKGSF